MSSGGLWGNIRHALGRTTNIFLPPVQSVRCRGCGRILAPDKIPFCNLCMARSEPVGLHELPNLGDFSHSNKVYKNDAHTFGQSDCERLDAPYYYYGAIRNGLTRLKSFEDTALVEYFAEAMVKRVKRFAEMSSFDFVTFVPMEPRREKFRGFNQSSLLAERISILTGLTLCDCLIERNKKRPQHELGFEQRYENVRDVYSLKEGADVKEKSVLLVDDIATSGSTIDACANTLKCGGAKRIFAICVAIHMDEDIMC